MEGVWTIPHVHHLIIQCSFAINILKIIYQISSVWINEDWKVLGTIVARALIQYFLVDLLQYSEVAHTAGREVEEGPESKHMCLLFGDILCWVQLKSTRN